MKRLIVLIVAVTFIPGAFLIAQQESKLAISGELLSDQRVLLKGSNNWVWNENRITLKLDKRSEEKSRFYSEIWLRNFGIPNIVSSSDLYNKGITDPLNMEIREAYFRLNGFLTKRLDVTIGRQRIAWGTADKLNPTDNINPYDLEDVLDFGRHRGSDAINLNYYFSNYLSLQAIFVPLFTPANLPAGIFSNALNPDLSLPAGITLRDMSDTLIMPQNNIREGSSFGFKIKGFAAGIDFSLSYLIRNDPLPFITRNTFIPADLEGGVNVNTTLAYSGSGIVGADMATSLGGVGLWAEAALFIPKEDVVMTNDFTALYPFSPSPVTRDSLLLDKSKPFIKFILGGDYIFSNGIYVNIQYMHGFLNERGRENLNDYLFLRFEKSLFNDKIKISPLNGAIIVNDWKNINDNYAFAYMPELIYKASSNSQLTISSVIFSGKGDNLFAKLKNSNMLMFKYKYNF
jgi:hypothetical protein